MKDNLQREINQYSIFKCVNTQNKINDISPLLLFFTCQYWIPVHGGHGDEHVLHVMSTVFVYYDSIQVDIYRYLNHMMLCEMYRCHIYLGDIAIQTFHLNRGKD